MKLAAFTGQYFWFDGESYSTDEAFSTFVASFHPYFEKIIFCDPVMPDRLTKPYKIDPAVADVRPLPYFNLNSWKSMLVSFPKTCRMISRHCKDWDVLWLHAPHPASLAFFYIFRKMHKPFFFFVRQNLPKYVRFRNHGLKRLAAIFIALVLDNLFRLLSHRITTFTVGKEMYDKYSKTGRSVHPVFVSLISEKDLPRKQIPRQPGSPVRVLSVGRLDPEKGAIHLIRAMAILLQNGKQDFILNIVGDGREKAALETEVRRLGLTKYVKFYGYISFGPELLSLYEASDLFVLPSLTEGCPQTLFEAMAYGLPVVATKVGGIPDLIADEENGLLVHPGNPKDMSHAIERLITDTDLKDRLSKNAFFFARDHTLEAERQRMFAHIEPLVVG